MRKAVYHQESPLVDKTFSVESINEDGTVNLADENGTVIVSRCRIADEGEKKPGTCTLVKAEGKAAAVKTESEAPTKSAKSKN